MAVQTKEKKYVGQLARIARAVSRVSLKKCTDEWDSMRFGGDQHLAKDDRGSSKVFDGVLQSAKKNAAVSNDHYEAFDEVNSGFHGMHQPKSLKN